MTVSNYGRDRIALFIGGSITDYPSNMFIGKGSGTSVATTNALISGADVQALTSTTFPSSNKIKWQADWNSVEMSGIQLAEFAMASGTDATGSVWSRTGIPSLTFDGTNELRIEQTFEVLN